MDSATVVQIITAVTALVAVIVGPWQSARTARQQIQAGIETARRQIRAEVVSANRQEWINTLRNNLADLLAGLQVWGSPVYSERYSEADHKETFRQILEREAKIRLMLNPTEDDHRKLVGAISDARMTAGENQPPEHDQEVHQLLASRIELVIQQSQVIMKREWERVKAGD
jgi:hypothetical protein